MVEERAVPTVPAVSLGELLTAVRTRHGLTRDEIGRSAGLAADRVASVESGFHDLTEIELDALLDACPASISRRRSSHLLVEIDLDGGMLRLHRDRSRWGRRVGRAGRPVPVADRNLLRYLTLVHEHLDLHLGHDIPLKAADLGLLRASLALRRDQVNSRLDHMAGAAGSPATRNRSLLAVAAATGLVVAAGAVVLVPLRSGSTGPARGHDQDQSPRAGSPAGEEGAIPPPQIDIGTPMVVERDPAAISAPAPAQTPTQTPASSFESFDAGPVPVPAAAAEPRIGTPLVLERPASAAIATSLGPTDTQSRGPPRD